MTARQPPPPTGQPTPAGDPAQEGGTQAIRRAIGILRILAMAREAGYGLSEVSRLTGLARPTAHRILLALID
ncbi:helix-turn-helix domain-containing protein, partial [Acinetobacter baumannii]